MRPKQKVIIYAGSPRDVQGARSMMRNEINAARRDIDTLCVRCNRKLKFPERRHYSDPKNRTPCIEKKVY